MLSDWVCMWFQLHCCSKCICYRNRSQEPARECSQPTLDPDDMGNWCPRDDGVVDIVSLMTYVFMTMITMTPIMTITIE
jgi:hypothetical protein